MTDDTHQPMRMRDVQHDHHGAREEIAGVFRRGPSRRDRGRGRER